MRKLVTTTVLNFFLSLLILYPAYFLLMSIESYSRTNLLLLITIIINAVFCITLQASVLINKRLKNKINYIFLLSLQAIFPWLIFFGYFFVQTRLFPLSLTIMLTMVWVSMLRINTLVTLIASLIIVFGALLTFTSGFEEGYCTDIGSKYGTTMQYDLTEYEKDFLGPGSTTITMSLRKHLECHQTFDWRSAILDTYF